MPDQLPNPTPNARPAGVSTIIASGLLLAALALIVLYTSRRAFLSPLALVVIAATGLAALLLQVRLRPGAAAPNAQSCPRKSLWLTALGLIFATGAVFGDILRLRPGSILITAFAAVICFAVSGISLLNAFRKGHI